MSKLTALIKASMTENMSLFRVKTKSSSKNNKNIVQVALFSFIMFIMWYYADNLIDQFNQVGMAHVALLLFLVGTIILTFIEGIYKSSGLLFNCKDDNLLFSLPIKKGTVLGIRVFKFYVFELLYNTMFLLPAMLAYATHVNVEFTFYVASLAALIFLPMIPIAISCMIGMFMSTISSKFKKHNLVQIILTIIFLLAVIFVSFNTKNLVDGMVSNADSINNSITGMYYPANLYANMITNFSVMDLLIFSLINIGILVIVVAILSKVYFSINSSVKNIKTKKSNKAYKIRTNSQTVSLIKKEFKRFISSPVFVTNAGFGAILFTAGCVACTIYSDSIIEKATAMLQISADVILPFIPLVLLIFIIISCFTTSITSSMISLEGRTFNILKSLPVKPYKVVRAKILTAFLIVIPFILLGDLFFFLSFNFNLSEILIILAASVVIPLVSQEIGIIVNLKFPKMDALNDTEIVKQSISSMISVFAGIALAGLSVYLIVSNVGVSIDLVMLFALLAYVIIYLVLRFYLVKISDKRFREINV